MSEPHTPHPAPKPLIPNTPATTMAAGGIGASLLAALGYLATEFVDMENRLARIEERATAQLAEMKTDINETKTTLTIIRERLAVQEQAILQAEGQIHSHSDILDERR